MAKILVKKSNEKIKCEIFSGLKYEFGGANSLGIKTFNNQAEATNFARKEAIDLFTAYINTPEIPATTSIPSMLNAGFELEDAQNLYFSNREKYLDYKIKVIA